MAKETAQALNELVGIFKDGMDFYKRGAETTESPVLKSLFEEMAYVRRNAVNELTPLIAQEGVRVRDHGTLTGEAHEAYTRLAGFFGSTDQAYIDQLEAHEDRTLEVFEDLLEEADLDPEAMQRLARQYITFKETHAKMRNLKQAMH